MRAFGKELSFGTGGLRGMMGVGTGRMNNYTVARASCGVARWLKAAGGTRVAISYDSRLHSREFAEVAAGMFATEGVVVHLYDRLMPTPLLSFAVRHLAADAGVMITASHNPSEYNGYKVYDRGGCQLTDGAAMEVSAEICRVSYEELVWMRLADARARGLLLDIGDDVVEAYYRSTLSLRVGEPGVGDLRIVYTPLNGTGLEPVRQIVRRMGGAPLILVPEQAQPDGMFPTCPKPNPEDPDALTLAVRLGREAGADLVLGTDPDCDRVGVVSLEKDGVTRFLTGDEVGLLLTEYLLSKKEGLVRAGETPLIVKTIVSSDLTFEIAKTYDGEVVEVLTGFKYIGEYVGRLDGAGRQFLLGFEESCGYLSGGYVRDKDGVLAVMLVIEMAAHYRGMGLSLSQAISALYRRYGYCKKRLMNFELRDGNPDEQLDAIMRRLRENLPRELGGRKVVQAEDYLDGVGGLPRSNVISIRSEADDKVVFRPSGTEPKMKVYLFASADSEGAAERRLDELAAQVERIVM
jgi:phosphoglucomutase